MGLSWQIGKVKIHQIVELIDKEMFLGLFPLATKDIIRQIPWLSPHFADSEGNLIAYVQSFVIESDGKKILVDTCNGNDKERPNVPTWSKLQTNYLEKLDQAGFGRETIDIVLCTHLHFDHVGWNTMYQDGELVPTFPNAKYLFSQAEYNYWKSRPEKEMVDDHMGIADSVEPIIQAGLTQLVSDDYQLDDQISFIPTPGHTPHHISLHIKSEGQEGYITGDVLHHPCQMTHPEWSTVVDTIPDRGIQSRRHFLGLVADKDMLVIGTHFANPVAGKVVSDNQTYKFIPSTNEH